MSVAKYDPNTGKPLAIGQTVTVKGTNITVTGGKSGTGTTSSSSKSSSSGSSSSSSGSSSTSQLITHNPNTGALLKPGEVVQIGTTGKYIQQGAKHGTYVSAPTPTSPTTSTPISSANLKIGSRGSDVTNLQNFLISQGYNVGATGADGIYGANTDAAVKAYQKAQGLTADGIVGVNTSAMMNKTLATAPLAGDPSLTDPNIDPPTLPTLTADNMQNSYMESLNNQILQLQTQIDQQKQDYLSQIQFDKEQARQELAEIRSQQQDTIDEQGRLSIEAKERKLEEIDKNIARFDEAYKVKQGLTTQLQDLITQGNALITSQKATTGLTAIRNPRVNETISNLSAAAAVLKIGIDAQDGNMVNVQNQINVAVSAITSAYKDQLDYYTTLNNFYESKSVDTGNKLINLTAAEQDFLITNIATLQDRINLVQANADAMQNLFLDPTTATAFARAGITLNTPQSEWGPKLAKQAYADELSLLSRDMASSGYTALIGGNAPAGAEVVSITDSIGNVKTYWKKADGTGTGSNVTPTGLLQTAINSGMSPEEAALDVASYYDSIGVSVNNTTLNSWIVEARKLKTAPVTPTVEAPIPSTSSTTPMTAREVGEASAPIIKNTINPLNSPLGIIGPKEIIDVSKSIGNFFKGLATGL